ncbi:UNKNOWN [Stylonychia lemnae]|uniref:Uncharacterized protein n=1 Tax=Stylonychia lemnae TaxID=5949 RepID=A0A078B9V9_STYLE|nr:UNKNOWN [Stylonychia lemnae]|eukprot:CDW91209.1 UNKNOWN [Stylonychia lemnae]
MSSHYTESFRAGGARKTDKNDTDTMLSQHGRDGNQEYLAQNHLKDKHAENIGKVMPDSTSGGGHRGVLYRYGNDEMKPDIMNEDAKMHENKMTQRQWDSDKELSFENACREEKQLLNNCHSDNKTNREMCKELADEVINCQRTYGKYFPTEDKFHLNK